ncbi:uncharacterized protein EV422DRAFT_503582 [Fimicolochytrium jonesii]|uniref:uncharacterized protein n=1 Tax=Fimicolochytrium jonesii TaxID=1396493 RepID=UPI0022FE5B1C|nr:uncharacterized protein EV422DRAFT_503582 [Fimicolochytrium jonesii]KAI8826299.1 hypothetical protein EV422DRAFT_503582 [Fimicolochytrium jonesii]
MCHSLKFSTLTLALGVFVWQTAFINTQPPFCPAESKVSDAALSECLSSSGQAKLDCNCKKFWPAQIAYGKCLKLSTVNDARELADSCSRAAIGQAAPTSTSLSPSTMIATGGTATEITFPGRGGGATVGPIAETTEIAKPASSAGAVASPPRTMPLTTSVFPAMTTGVLTDDQIPEEIKRAANTEPSILVSSNAESSFTDVSEASLEASDVSDLDSIRRKFTATSRTLQNLRQGVITVTKNAFKLGGVITCVSQLGLHAFKVFTGGFSAVDSSGTMLAAAMSDVAYSTNPDVQASAVSNGIIGGVNCLSPSNYGSVGRRDVTGLSLPQSDNDTLWYGFHYNASHFHLAVFKNGKARALSVAPLTVVNSPTLSVKVITADLSPVSPVNSGGSSDSSSSGTNTGNVGSSGSRNSYTNEATDLGSKSLKALIGGVVAGAAGLAAGLG